jgi:septum site-determining protein MinC
MQTQHVVLKGTREGLVLYLDPHLEFNVLLDEIENNLTKANQFLQGASVRCYWGEKNCSEKQREILIGILKRYGLKLAGWLTSADLSVSEKQTQINSTPKAKQFWEDGMTEENCLFVERTLRSGKSIKFDGHVLVIGDVNPGAEIIAGGNIVVIGALRGVAHAGAAGDRKALVTAYYLNPTQLRIADHVTRPPDEEVAWRGPEIARISSGKIVVESLVININKGKVNN